MEHQGAPARSGPVANRRTRGNAMAGAWERPNGAGGWAVVLLGLVFILIGLALAIGGIWLIALGGSWYYALAGIGLVLTGVLLALRRRLGRSEEHTSELQSLMRQSYAVFRLKN